MLNLTLLRSFVVLAETGNFQTAARQLEIAQPTLSQHIRKLEEALGVPLIERSHAGSLPTRQGEAALPLARGLIASAERFRTAVREEEFLIGASSNIANYYMVPALSRFCESSSNLTDWRLVQDRNAQLIDKLERGEIDAAVTEWLPDQGAIRSVPWLTEPLVVIVPQAHELAGRKTISIRTLCKIPLIGGEPGTGTGSLLREALGENADLLRVVSSVGSTEAVKSAVMAGLGCSLILRGAVETEVLAGKLAVLDVSGATLRKTFFVSFRTGLPDNSPAARLARYLGRQYVSGN